MGPDKNANNGATRHAAYLHARPFLAFVVTVVLMHWLYIATGPLDLTVDEAYYWEWAQRLDYCYFSKGPVVAWLIALSTGWVGDTELGVRLLAPVLFAGTALLVYAMTTRLSGDPRAGTWAGVALHAMPLLLPAGLLMTIDPAYLFLATLFTWAMTRTLALKVEFSAATGAWALAALVAGVGFLTKYTMALSVALVGLALLVEPTWWRHWRTP
jgi:4-amino-4-deoxy-L-arabinose transferase-like glycosyltransferase